MTAVSAHLGRVAGFRRGHRPGSDPSAVGLSVPGAVVAAMVAAGFFACVFLGELLTRIDPRIVRRHFSI